MFEYEFSKNHNIRFKINDKLWKLKIIQLSNF